MFDGGAGPSRATTLVGYPQTIPTPQPWVGYPYRRPANDGLRGGAVSTVYLWSDAYVDELIAFERTAAHSRGPGRFYVHQNARHDVVAISDAAGALVEKRTFDDFGRMTVTYGSSVGLDLGFQGRRHDRETGLVYFRARYYDPQTGRFLSRDAVWDPGNVGNPYTFCANNPTSLIDPSGNWIEDSVFAVPSIALGAKSLGRNLGEGKFVSALIDVVGLVLDTAALLTPGVPGGAGQTIGGLRTAIRAGNAAMQAVGLGLAVAGELGMMEGEGEDDGGEAGGEDEPDMLGNCFLAGTLVSMADGTKRPIEEVRPGDRVKASDPRDGQVVDREVVRTFRNVTDTVVDVTWAPLDRVECMAVGSRGRGERHSVGVARAGGESSEDGEPPSADEAQTVRCTPGHPWWVEGQQRWVLAGDLRVGDQLRLEDGRLAAVQAVASRRQAARTFNFEVEGLHTYFVAGNQHAAGVCVHNASRLSFLADAGVFASRIGSPGIRRALRRGLDRVIAAGSRFHIHVIEEIETELTNAGRLRTWMTQLKRYMMAGATVIPSADTTKLTSLIAGKFGPNDLKLVQTAIERGLPIVTANPRLVNQVMNKPEFRGVGLRILVAGEHFTGARSLSAALADATVGLIR